VVLEPNGALSLNDRRHNERYGDLLRLEDAGDAATRTRTARRRATASSESRSDHGAAVWRVVRWSPRLEARWEMVRGIDVRLLVQLWADSPLVRITLEVDNQNRYHRLRARLPTALGGAPATAGRGLWHR